MRQQEIRRGLLIAAFVGLVAVTVGGITGSGVALIGGVIAVGAPLLWTVKAAMEMSVEMQAESEDRARFASAMEERQGALAQETQRIRRDLDPLTARIQQLEDDVTLLKQQRQNLHSEMERLESGIETFKSGATASLDLLLGSAHQGLRRMLSAEEHSELMQRWLPRLDLELSRQAIHYIERRALIVEQMCNGRLAASTADAVFRVLVGLSTASKSQEVLEIGTLFGVNAALLGDTIGASGIRVVQTLVDLFEGYYGDNALDRYTGLVATETLVEANLRRVGLAPSDFRLIKGDSSSPETFERVSDRLYDLVLIDGDHSFQGVSGDFERYWPLVKHGGYLLIDDYGAKPWPDVARFVDELIRDPHFDEDVEVFAQTALVQRRAGAT